MNLGLEGKVVLIGGGSRGIGRATAAAFAAEGARVAVTGRDERALEAVAQELGVVPVRADMRVRDDVERAVARVAEELGGLDVAVANAGSGRGPAGDAVGEAGWRELLDENLMTAVHLCETAPAAMAGSGAIVVVGSIAGMEFHPAPLPYSAAKAALVRYTRDLARRLAPQGVRVNLVAPGNVLFPGGSWQRKLDDDREGIEALIEREVPMNRFGRPEEIADAVVFLASDRSSFTTGAVLVADGGQLRA